MKKFKKTFMAVALLSMSVATAFAQATYTDAENNEYQFKKHAFLNLQGGAQYTLGEAKFDKLISPNVQFGIGYQFSPAFAIRLQANGWQSKVDGTVMSWHVPVILIPLITNSTTLLQDWI